MHIHLVKNCLEAIAVKVSIAEIRKLSDELVARRGVRIFRTIFGST